MIILSNLEKSLLKYANMHRRLRLDVANFSDDEAIEAARSLCEEGLLTQAELTLEEAKKAGTNVFYKITEKGQSWLRAHKFIKSWNKEAKEARIKKETMKPIKEVEKEYEKMRKRMKA